jgi:protein-tyrosine-phosphatase
MAEGILRSELSKNGILTIAASSMGIHAQDGNVATESAVEVCSEHGIDISAHRSRHLIPEELKNSHLILTMEPVQVDYLTLFFPQVADRTFMLGAWPEQKSRKATIKDPVGRSIEVYRKSFSKLQHNIDRLMPEFIERYRS